MKSCPQLRSALCVVAIILTLSAVQAQSVPEFECGGDGLTEIERLSLAPVEYGPEVRALVVLIRFRDDDTGSDPWIPIDSPYRGWPYWLLDESGDPVLDGNGDPIPADFETLPNFGHGLIAPSVQAITDSDSTMSAYFYEQSKAGPNGPAQFLLWGDVLPTDGPSWDQGDPIVYVTKHDNEWYHNNPLDPDSLRRGYGYLTKEVLDHLVYEQGLDLGNYNLNPETDDIVDQIFMIVRAEERDHYSGVSNLAYMVASGLSGIPPGTSEGLWYPSPSGMQDPNLPDSVLVTWESSGNYIWNSAAGNVHQATFYGRYGAHEFGHDLWRDQISGVHMWGLENSVPANEPANVNYYGGLLMGSSTLPTQRHFQNSHIISPYERSLFGWVALDTLSGTRYGVEVGDLYTRGEAAVLPIGTGGEERALFLWNRQRVGYFDLPHTRVNTQGDPYPTPAFQITGLIAHFRGRLDADDCGAGSRPCVDMLPPDNALDSELTDDAYKPGVKTQLTPWTRPNINGCNGGDDPYCEGLELTWAAVDDIRYLGDADSTLVFDFYEDFRTAPTVTIRADSWMGPETAFAFSSEVRVTAGATLTIEDGADVTFDGGLTVEDGGALVIEPGATFAVGENTILLAESGGSVVVAPGAEVTVETGAAVRGAPGAQLTIGTGATIHLGMKASVEASALTAVGTGLSPILFTRLSPGDAWGRVLLTGAADFAHDLQHVRIEGR